MTTDTELLERQDASDQHSAMQKAEAPVDTGHDAQDKSHDSGAAPHDNAKTAPTAQDKASEARLADIEKIFDNASIPYFERAKLALEYENRYTDLHFRHLVEKSKRGRPPGIVAIMEERLAVPGKSKRARCKWLERALKIAGISLEAQAAATRAELHRYQSSLLEIAKSDDPVEQLQIVDEIKKRRLASREQSKKFAKATIRYPVERKDEIRSRLASFADELGIEIL